MTRVRLVAADRFERSFRLRLPFRFGAITVTHGRQAVLRVRVRLDDGSESEGWGAESLVAKWFDKDPAVDDDANLDQLRRALELATEAYVAAGLHTPFGLYADTYGPHVAACGREGLNPLVAAFGPAMLDRAILDALCRARGISVFAAIRGNAVGLAPHPVIADRAGFDFDAFLGALRPAGSIEARHTVGLVDPIVAGDQTERVGDGLPETLAEVASVYGHRWFKLKVGGDLGADLDRLGRIAAVLDALPGGYRATLDGNEQYADAGAALELWRAIASDPRLGRLAAAVAFIEQPVRRSAALSAPVQALAAHRPVLIDESDDTLDAFPRGQALGYTGVSSKLCKGLYKSLVNRSRVGEAPGLFMSGEDLTTQAGVSVQQDLALAGLLGLTHVERNGHHFIDGFAERGAGEADAFLAAHPDLYHRQDGRVRLRISDGRIAMGSLGCVGFAAGALPDLGGLSAMGRAAWRKDETVRPAFERDGDQSRIASASAT